MQEEISRLEDIIQLQQDKLVRTKQLQAACSSSSISPASISLWSNSEHQQSQQLHQQ
jgi:hypothetical protein